MNFIQWFNHLKRKKNTKKKRLQNKEQKRSRELSSCFNNKIIIIIVFKSVHLQLMGFLSEKTKTKCSRKDQTYTRDDDYNKNCFLFILQQKKKDLFVSYFHSFCFSDEIITADE